MKNIDLTYNSYIYLVVVHIECLKVAFAFVKNLINHYCLK